MDVGLVGVCVCVCGGWLCALDLKYASAAEFQHRVMLLALLKKPFYSLSYFTKLVQISKWSNLA